MRRRRLEVALSHGSCLASRLQVHAAAVRQRWAHSNLTGRVPARSLGRRRSVLDALQGVVEPHLVLRRVVALGKVLATARQQPRLYMLVRPEGPETGYVTGCDPTVLVVPFPQVPVFKVCTGD